MKIKSCMINTGSLFQSVTPSHSMTANYQQVLASMKSHSSLLCGAAAAAATPRRTAKKCHKRTRSKTSASSNKLQSLLAGLEEEFGHLTLYVVSY